MNLKIMIAVFTFFGFSTFISFSQESIIEINNTNISVPNIYDFGTISEVAYSKYIIKNKRNSKVIVNDIQTPAGFFASISDKNIASGKKVILYFGLDPAHSNIEGYFNDSIILKTNLITDIIIKIKGNIVKSTEE